MSDTIIETKGLTVYYGRQRGIVDVDLHVRRGEIFGFLGPNGAGKTTTQRVLMDVIRPIRGSASIFGHVWAWVGFVKSPLTPLFQRGEQTSKGSLVVNHLFRRSVPFGEHQMFFALQCDGLRS